MNTTVIDTSHPINSDPSLPLETLLDIARNNNRRTRITPLQLTRLDAVKVLRQYRYLSVAGGNIEHDPFNEDGHNLIAWYGADGFKTNWKEVLELIRINFART